MLDVRVVGRCWNQIAKLILMLYKINTEWFMPAAVHVEHKSQKRLVGEITAYQGC